MKSKWISVAKIMIVLFTVILFFNALLLFKEIRRDVNYSNRAYGLAALDDLFDEGQYQELYERAISNGLSDETVEVDTSQYEAFGRYYHAYTLARQYEGNTVYRQRKEAEKQNISWAKIINVINALEKDLKK